MKYPARRVTRERQGRAMAFVTTAIPLGDVDGYCVPRRRQAQAR
jgi:hypothetical protein